MKKADRVRLGLVPFRVEMKMPRRKNNKGGAMLVLVLMGKIIESRVIL